MRANLDQLPPDIRKGAVALIRERLTLEEVARIKALREEYGDDWFIWMSTLRLPPTTTYPEGVVIPRGHFDWGMRLRNYLRERGIPDAGVPGANLDEYYVELVEEAIDQ